MCEAIYHSCLNFSIIVIFLISWSVLTSRLKEYVLIPQVAELRKKLTTQMILYMIFIFFRAVCLLVPSIIYLVNINGNSAALIFYFLEPVLGDCPLVYELDFICFILVLILFLFLFRP
jgi:Na+/melibiose symporter-like transporter